MNCYKLSFNIIS
uniref:Uncharacterized protein n=1 Tax=Rhizophora mucronata TaxID=61149 RepID=A0A2P2IIM2_RHIMU